MAFWSRLWKCLVWLERNLDAWLRNKSWMWVSRCVMWWTLEFGGYWCNLFLATWLWVERNLLLLFLFLVSLFVCFWVDLVYKDQRLQSILAAFPPNYGWCFLCCCRMIFITQKPLRGNFLCSKSKFSDLELPVPSLEVWWKGNFHVMWFATTSIWQFILNIKVF